MSFRVLIASELKLLLPDDPGHEYSRRSHRVDCRFGVGPHPGSGEAVERRP